MSDAIFQNSLHSADADVSKEQRRLEAVRAALELMHAEALGGGERSGDIAYHLPHLSTYADAIEEALG
jgi:hypothetical protein